DFYGFTCRKWLSNHPLSPLELKRSWLTERSQNIRDAFAERLANLSEIEAYNYQLQADKNNTQESVEDTTLNYFDGLSSDKNERIILMFTHLVFNTKDHKPFAWYSFKKLSIEDRKTVFRHSDSSRVHLSFSNE
ncbi:unnamed protein product, partial [Rotaria socialis]